MHCMENGDEIKCSNCPLKKAEKSQCQLFSEMYFTYAFEVSVCVWEG